jgi:Tfp pilus assembly protein PilV
MMLLGFAGLGFMAYRRTKSAAVQSIASRATSEAAQ